ncbi:MAG: hypothetical protein OQK58_06280, partial [Gammaproteobacteria bacterium]|nr:hypothetical protein [Gammaproteobacteria bacterium]
LESYINGQSGWYRDWQTVSSLNERVNADTQTLTQQLLITTFLPSTDSCKSSGTTGLYSLYNITGTAHPGAGRGTDCTITNAGSCLITDVKTFGGESFANLVCIGSQCTQVVQGSNDDDNDDGDCTTKDGGVCTEEAKKTPGKDGRQSWREIYLEEDL